MDKCEQCQGTGSIIANATVYLSDGTNSMVGNPVVKCPACGGAKVKGGWEARTREAEAGAHSWMDKWATAEKALAEVREVVERMPELRPERCANGFQCHCGAAAASRVRIEARQLLGLELKP